MKTPTAVVTQKSNPLSRYGRNPWVMIGAMALLVVIVFSGFFFSDSMLYSSDQITGIDSKVYMHNSLVKHHQFPFWFNPRLGGMPTIDALFGDAFYPISVAINTVFPVHRAISLKMILHVFLAGLFFFLMLYRGFRMGAPLAFAGGVLYMLNPEFFSHIYPGHDGKMFVIAWVPYMLWRLKALSDAPSLLNATFLGIGIGLALLTSHVQLTYFVLWGLFFYSVVAAILSFREKQVKKGIRFTAWFWGAVAIGLGLGFIQLYPSYMYVQDAFSVRGVDRGFEYAASWSLHWPEFLSLWVPEFGNTLDYYCGGNPFKLNSEYAGGVVLLLAVVAVVWKSRPWRWFWLGLAAFAVLYSLGANTPFFRICYEIIPGVKKFRACSMIMFWFSFATLLLAILFCKDLLAGELSRLAEARKKKLTKGLWIAMGGIAAIALFFSFKDMVAGALPFIGTMDTQKRRVFDENFSRNFVPMLWLWFFFAATMLGLVIGVVQGKVKPAAAVSVFFIIGCIDVLRVDAQFVKLINPRPYFYAEPAVQKLQAEMAAAPFRVFSLPGALQQNGEGVMGLEGVGGFHDNELRWYREWRGDQQDRNYFDRILGFGPDGGAYLKADQISKGNPFLDVANVKYLLARNGSELMALENRNALGRISFASKYLVMDSSKIVPSLQSGGYDYRTTVALLAEPPLPSAPPVSDSLALQFAAQPLSTEWQQYTPNDRTVKVTVPADGFLRISEAYYPGWSCTIDGKSSPLYRADLAWMATPVTRGDHTVVLKARSLFFPLAVKVTATTLAALCLYWLIAGLFLRRRGAPSNG
jgi:hypothetical protein